MTVPQELADVPFREVRPDLPRKQHVLRFVPLWRNLMAENVGVHERTDQNRGGKSSRDGKMLVVILHFAPNRPQRALR